MDDEALLLRKDLLEHFLDDSGFLGLTRDPSAGYSEANATLYTAEAYLLLHLLHRLMSEDTTRFCSNIDDVSVVPGLLCRHPNMKHMLEAHDNYIGVCACAYHLKLKGFLDNVWIWGKAHNLGNNVPDIDNWKIRLLARVVRLFRINMYWYNNLEPDKFRIEALKQGSHTAFIDICADKNPSWFNQLWLAGAIIVSIYTEGTSTKLLSMLMLTVLKRRNWLFKLTHWWFYKKINVSAVARGYFGELPYARLFELAEEKLVD